MKKKRLLGFLAICALGILGMSGCSGEDKTINDEVETSGNLEAKAAYQETEIELPKEAGTLVALHQLKDGSLKGVGSEGQILTSTDHGETWDTISLDSQVSGKGNIDMACVSDEGALILAVGEDSEEEKQENRHTYYFVSQEGEQREIKPEVPGDDTLIFSGFLSETEALAWYQGDASFYRISVEDGEAEKLFEAATGYQACCVTGGEIVTDAHNSLMIYDLDRGITRMVKAEGTVGRKLAAGTEEGTFYLLNTQGIYLCRTEDGKGELVVSTNTLTAGNPSYSAVSFLQQDNGDFLAMYQDEKDNTHHLMKYSTESGQEDTAHQPAQKA